MERLNLKSKNLQGRLDFYHLPKKGKMRKTYHCNKYFQIIEQIRDGTTPDIQASVLVTNQNAAPASGIFSR